MNEQLFDVVFFGILQTGKDREVVMQNMAALFKTDSAKLAPYFAGGRKVIKGKINQETAEKYKAALENVGLVIKLEACQHDTASNQAAATDNSQPGQETASTAQNQATQGQAHSDEGESPDTKGITMAEVGADVIENPVAVEPRAIGDISAISMAEVGADVIENPVPVEPQKIADISDITMAEVGSDVLEHPVEVVAQPIADIPDISLAEVGADIIENPTPVKPAAIKDTSELSLDDNSTGEELP
jgi:hypothetical protein